MHLHLDIVGGVAGDMFVASMLAVQPEVTSEHLAQILEQAGFPELVELEVTEFNDGILTGVRFNVHADNDAEGHHHRHYSDIRNLINAGGLAPGVKQRAQDIFHILAKAEATVHNRSVEEVAFHEVGAWDSIADVICAAYLIERAGITSCSCSKLPLGGGNVKTAHGLLPVPAPATALILEGFQFRDDGIPGERITPTGAAILKHLQPSQQHHPGGTLTAQGYGFGTRKMEGISNILRALFFSVDTGPTWDYDQVQKLQFEVDDQTPEEIADSADRLRQLSGVRDVSLFQGLGKKGRPVFSFQLLTDPEVQEHVLAACFDQTTTLGIRTEVVTRAVLKREELDGIKQVQRPAQQTAKLDMEAVRAMEGSLSERRNQRTTREMTSLGQKSLKDKP